jgi:hypothetical protein
VTARCETRLGGWLREEKIPEGEIRGERLAGVYGNGEDGQAGSW